MGHEIDVGCLNGTDIRATFSQKVDAFGDTSYSKTALRERLNGTDIRATFSQKVDQKLPFGRG